MNLSTAVERGGGAGWGQQGWSLLRSARHELHSLYYSITITRGGPVH